MEIYLRGSGTGDSTSVEPERVRVRIERGRLTGVERLDPLRGADVEPAPALEPLLLAGAYDSLRVERIWRPLSRIPRVIQDAVIASEDRRFRRHLGLDLRSNMRALARNVRAGGVRQGASTITQQLARGLFLGRELQVRIRLLDPVLAVVGDGRRHTLL